MNPTHISSYKTSKDSIYSLGRSQSWQDHFKTALKSLLIVIILLTLGYYTPIVPSGINADDIFKFQTSFYASAALVLILTLIWIMKMGRDLALSLKARLKIGISTCTSCNGYRTVDIKKSEGKIRTVPCDRCNGSGQEPLRT